MGRLQGRRDVGPSAEAGIYQAAVPQAVERLAIDVRALRLDEHRLLPFQAQPLKVLVNALDELRPAPRLVEVLDPKQESAADFLRPGSPKRRTVSVAQMQPAGRRRGEAGDVHMSPT